MKQLYLGIDVGTTHLKVCAIDEKGNCLAVAERDQEFSVDNSYGDCIRAEDLFERCAECIFQILQTVNAECVRAIGITSMAEAGIPIDDSGNALMPLVPWNGKKTLIHKPEFPDKLSEFAIYEKTGLCWHPKYTINKILMMQNNRPDLLKKMNCFLSVSDYILFRLTGDKKTDESLACRTMLYHIHKREWDSELTEYCGMKGKLPEVIKNDADWPLMSEKMTKMFGLKKVKVCVAGHDHLCATKALGISNHDILNSMGTSEVYIGFLEELPNPEVLFENGILLGRFQNKYYWICNLPSSGASIEWFRNLYKIQERKISYRMLMEIPYERNTSLIYLPFVNGAGTHRKKKIEGGFFGIEMDSEIKKMLGAIYEGIACESSTILKKLLSAGIIFDKIYTVGGGTKNKNLMQVKADFTEHVFEIDRQTQATAIGAAMIAGKLCGRKKIERSVHPDDLEKKQCRDKYNKYEQLIRKLEE